MKVYKFKIKLKDFEDKVYREIEFSENSSVAKLAYAILVSFDTDGSHLYNIEWKNNHFENIFDTEEELINGINFYLNPSLYKLNELKLKIGDKLNMEYDYGAGWEFDIELIDIYDMKKGAHRHYPYITAGIGSGIYEEGGPSVLDDAFKKDGIINLSEEYIQMLKDQYFEELDEDEKKYIADNNIDVTDIIDRTIDFNDYNIYLANMLLKREIELMEDAYEMHDVNYEKKPLDFKDVKEEKNIIDVNLYNVWNKIDGKIKKYILNNAFCFNCSQKYGPVPFCKDYCLVKKHGRLVVKGKCSVCNSEIEEYV